MSDMDSNIDSGVDGATTSQTSGENAKPDSIDTAKIVAEVLKQLDPVLDKKVQSVKDRRFESFEQRLTKAFEKQGMAPEDAKELVARLPKQAESSTDNAKPETVGNGAVGAIADKVLEASGIKLDDPDVLALKQQSFANEQEKLVKVAELVAKRANPQPASPAATPPPSGTTSAQRTLESVTAELQSELKKTNLDHQKVMKLQEEQRQLLS